MRYVALAALVCLALVAQPVVADAGAESVDVRDLSTEELGDGNGTEVTVRYKTTVTVKLNTYLFGSEELQDEIVDAVGVEEEHVEFESLDTESAEMVYEGGSDEINFSSVDS